MSTKSTTTYGENFHLYREALDDDFIYLELDNIEFERGSAPTASRQAQVSFEASKNSVKVAIPVHIWEHLRQYKIVDLSWADKTDEEIREYVEEKVEERIERFRKNNSLFANIAGSLQFGNANLPRQEQIKNGIYNYIEWREEQKKVKQAIEELRRK